MHSLAKTRVHQMAKATGVDLTDDHMAVLDYAWSYYRSRSVGPLYNNIRRQTGIARKQIDGLFPNGLSSVYTWVGIPVQSTIAGCKPMALLEVENLREVYFDHNATTPLRPEVIREMVSFFEDPRSFGNPSSSYDIGSQAYDIIDRARTRVARCLGVDPGEIYFVGSGSEANNLAIKGVADRYKTGHIISTNIEHPSVMETLRHLESRGYEVSFLAVERDGTLCAGAVEAAIRDNTILVTIMAANNEIGTIYPSREIGAICRDRGIPFMVDAIQGFGKIPLSPKDMGIAMLTTSGHKIYAPKGVAAIFVDQNMALNPLISGGGQEKGLRAGTENVAGILAMGLAAELACREMDGAMDHLRDLRNYFLENLERVVPGAVVNGTLEHRLPNNLSIGFPGVDSGSLLLSFNQIGIYVSAGSACSAGDEKLSHVLEAIGVDAEQYGTVRFSFGRHNSREDIDYLFEHLPAILDQLAGLAEDTGENTSSAA